MLLPLSPLPHLLSFAGGSCLASSSSSFWSCCLLLLLPFWWCRFSQRGAQGRGVKLHHARGGWRERHDSKGKRRKAAPPKGGGGTTTSTEPNLSSVIQKNKIKMNFIFLRTTAPPKGQKKAAHQSKEENAAKEERTTAEKEEEREVSLPYWVVSSSSCVRYRSLTATISHDNNNNHRTSKHASKSWRSDDSPSCLRGSGPGQNPQYTRAHFGGEAVGGSPTPQHSTMSPRKRNTITTWQRSKCCVISRCAEQVLCDLSVRRASVVRSLGAQSKCVSWSVQMFLT